MSAVVVPFPVARRLHQISRLACRMAKASPTQSELILLQTLRQLRSSLEVKGVARPLIAAQLASLEGNVRRELWSLVLRGEGGAA